MAQYKRNHSKDFGDAGAFVKVNEVRIITAQNLFEALYQANLADSKEEGYANDLEWQHAGQDNLFGHLANAVKALGYEDEYNEFVTTGELPERVRKN